MIGGVLGAALVVVDGSTTLRVAELLFVVAAACGLQVAAGWGGLPLLSQGAFVGVGAYGYALARDRLGVGCVVGLAVAVVTSGLAGAGVAGVVTRLGDGLVAVVTWLATWMFSLSLGAFPWLAGGSRGVLTGPPEQRIGWLGVTVRASPTSLAASGLGLLALSIGASEAVRRRYGSAFALARSDRGAASVAGVRVERLRGSAIVHAAIVAGIAGAGLAQVSGVADPTAYGPLFSAQLLLVVLIGGATSSAGPVVGAAAVVTVSRLADRIDGGGSNGSLLGGGRVVVASVATGFLLVFVVALGRSGLFPIVSRMIRLPSLRADQGGPKRTGGRRADCDEAGRRAPVELVVEDVRIVFGGVVALDGVAIRVAAGTCHAVVGANGSGKSTLCRVLAGAIEAPGSRIVLGGEVLTQPDLRSRYMWRRYVRRPFGTTVADRVASGVARSLQRPATPLDVTVLDQVRAGTESWLGTGWWRALLATPRSRAGGRAATAAALAALDLVGVEVVGPNGESGKGDAGQLTVGERRLVQLARAVAARPSVLLLDEPAAGLDVEERTRVVAAVRAIVAQGVTVVLVEHDLSLVSAVADRVTVLDAGRVLAEGAPGDVLSTIEPSAP